MFRDVRCFVATFSACLIRRVTLLKFALIVLAEHKGNLRARVEVIY